MKKILLMMLAGAVCLSITACGDKEDNKGNSSKTEEPEVTVNEEYVGKYIAVAGMMGEYYMNGDDVKGYAIELKEDGSAVASTDYGSDEGTWSSDDENIVLEAYLEEYKGVASDDIIVFEDYMGMEVTFAREGTDAANPELYIPEADKAMVGTWKSYAVKNVLDEDMSGEISPEALTLTFSADYTVDINYNGEEITEQKWTLYDNYGYLADSDYDINWDVNGEEIIVTCNMDEYYKFSCKKQ